MSNYAGNNNDVMGGNGMNLYGGGSWGLLILLFLFFAVFCGRGLFGGRDGRDGHGDGCGCGRRNWFPDESNYEEERNLKDKICYEEDKTRDLIRHESERASDRRELEKDMKIQRLESEKYMDNKIGGLYGVVKDGFCKTDRDIDRLSCESLKRPPTWGVSSVPCNQVISTGCGGGRRRDRDEDCCGDFF